MFLTPSRRRVAVGLAGAAALVLCMAACGEKKDENTPGAGGSAAASVSSDTTLADKVPAAIKADGKITVGTDSTYAPSEFLDNDGKTVIGFDVDLFTAVAGKLGLKAEFQSSKFEDVIPGVQSGKYEVGVSSLTINDERKKQALMVSYFSAGTQWAAKKGSTINPDDACGKRIAVQTGTVQETDDLPARQKKCKDAGKPEIKVDSYQAQSEATAAVISGKDDAMLADSPVCAYAVKQTNGQLDLVGQIYDSAPYGYVVKNDQQAFAEAIRDAVKALIADGTYKTILAKWGVDAGALSTDPAINP
ncbi:ABC transporter substrate-binding protein [Dactylosporangium sp. NPDC051484]|uniref:ABC transporter substrate-binding protein n=1 Tax=Dactylosporangium sp. NPDC051484 TaxID=3154942 RepID=UPI003450A6FD